jgi:hypothetical protein
VRRGQVAPPARLERVCAELRQRGRRGGARRMAGGEELRRGRLGVQQRARRARGGLELRAQRGANNVAGRERARRVVAELAAAAAAAAQVKERRDARGRVVDGEDAVDHGELEAAGRRRAREGNHVRQYRGVAVRATGASVVVRGVNARARAERPQLRRRERGRRRGRRRARRAPRLRQVEERQPRRERGERVLGEGGAAGAGVDGLERQGEVERDDARARGAAGELQHALGRGPDEPPDAARAALTEEAQGGSAGRAVVGAGPELQPLGRHERGHFRRGPEDAVERRGRAARRHARDERAARQRVELGGAGAGAEEREACAAGRGAHGGDGPAAASHPAGSPAASDVASESARLAASAWRGGGQGAPGGAGASGGAAHTPPVAPAAPPGSGA